MLIRLALGLALVAGAAVAEPASPPSAQSDPADIVAVYKHLLSEANERVAAASAQAQANARKAEEAAKSCRPPPKESE